MVRRAAAVKEGGGGGGALIGGLSWVENDFYKQLRQKSAAAATSHELVGEMVIFE